jgi:hypothetical protein
VRKLLLPIALLAVMAVAPVARSSPPNIDADHPKAIEALPFHEEVDTTGLQAIPGQPDGSCGAPGPSVWYVFTPDGNTTLTFDTAGSDYDTSIAVYRGTNAADEYDFYEVACNDDGTGPAKLVFDAAAGVAFRIQVAGSGGSTGHLVFDLIEGGTTPEQVAFPNDDFQDAEQITSLPFERAHDLTLKNTIEPGEPLPEHASCPFDRRRTVWYRYTPSQDQDVLLTLRGNRHWLSFVAFYRGVSTLADLQYMGCAWEMTGGWTQLFHLSAGQDYYLQVGTDSLPPEQSPINGFEFKIAPELDLGVTKLEVEESPVVQGVPAISHMLHLEITNFGDIPTGVNADYVLWACPKTAGSCADIDHVYFELPPHGILTRDLAFTPTGLGDYTVYARVRIRSALDVNLANDFTSAAHSFSIPESGVGAGVGNTCLYTDGQNPCPR